MTVSGFGIFLISLGIFFRFWYFFDQISDLVFSGLGIFRFSQKKEHLLSGVSRPVMPVRVLLSSTLTEPLRNRAWASSYHFSLGRPPVACYFFVVVVFGWAIVVLLLKERTLFILFFKEREWMIFYL